MKNFLATIAVLIILPLAASASENTQKLYRWVDSDGIVHYGDSIPAEFTDLERQVVNNYGITVGVMRAKRTEEEIAEDKRQDDLRLKRALQRRQDQALLATYLTVDEILLHRDRRVELFQAQARVTALYLSNPLHHLASSRAEASNYQPSTNTKHGRSPCYTQSILHSFKQRRPEKMTPLSSLLGRALDPEQKLLHRAVKEGRVVQVGHVPGAGHHK